MDQKNVKPGNKSPNQMKSLRMHIETQKKIEKLLYSANKKNLGRRVKIDQLLCLALSLVTSDHITTLQDQSLTNEDRKEQLRQRYIAIHGPTSKDEFLGLMLSPQFQQFLSEQTVTGTSVLHPVSIAHTG
jgi:hypothetical protein